AFNHCVTDLSKPQLDDKTKRRLDAFADRYAEAFDLVAESMGKKADVSIIFPVRK
ncbi:hypothetical protein KIPB_008767, partial [Kipferlia bialata]